MNKKAIVILGAIFLLIVGTLGFLVYSRYSGGEEEVSDAPAADDTGGDETDAEDDGISDDSGENGETATTSSPTSLEKFVKLYEGEQVISPILFYNGNGVTFLNQNGELIKSDFETGDDGVLTLTRTRNLNIQSKSGIVRILWPKNGDDFMAEINQGEVKRFSYFNFATGAYVGLPEQVRALEWLPAGDKILFIWVDKDASGNEKAALNIANPDTSNYQEIAQLWEADDALYLSPDGSNILLHRTKNTQSVNKVIMTTSDGKEWRDMAKEGYNYGVLWSPDSQKFIFGKRERAGRNYQLWIYDLYTGEVKNLGVYGIPQKAVWAQDSKTLYFAAPKDAAQIVDPGLLDGDGSAFTTDGFYKLDTASLAKSEYLPESFSIDGRDLFLNPSEDKLFFKNAQDGGLYYLDLTE